jgi:hypothetical protein
MLRVLKPGAFAFVMCAPRSDLQARMSILLEDAGFNIAFTPIYWTFATGFPKAQNISKQIDKRNGRTSKEHKELGKYLKKQRIKLGLSTIKVCEIGNFYKNLNHGAAVSNWELGKNVPTMKQWKILKPLLNLDDRFDKLIERKEAEREIIGRPSNYCKGRKESWLKSKPAQWVTKDATPEAQKYNGAYAGYQPKPAVEVVIVVMKPRSEKTYVDQCLNNGHGITWLDDCRIPSGAEQGRFPANLLVSDDSLNDGIERKSTGGLTPNETSIFDSTKIGSTRFNYGDNGSYSRYFDLDAWFAIIPKPSKKEKNEGTELNNHPTVKPIKLMSYLITLGSRPGEVVLDPFMGSGTTGISAKLLGRKFIGYEMEQEYYQIAEARIKHHDQEVLI